MKMSVFDLMNQHKKLQAETSALKEAVFCMEQRQADNYYRKLIKEIYEEKLKNFNELDALLKKTNIEV